MNGLPLLESELVHMRSSTNQLVQISIEPTALIPSRMPSEGEQYRFHFDMSKCIGCKCCVVACNEQNGNPAEVNWRRVGEVEGGHYPNTQRHYLSMGCNHCVEPSCLTGCPVEAYEKIPETGVVIHSADTCIGCQYCVWNCSYGVPQYNPERGVVGKCDLCHNRLSDGMAPACASACPEGAIAIEIVNVADWRKSFEHSLNSGMPFEDDSISTTRITLPLNTPPDLGRVDTQHLEAEPPHWPLVFMLVLTQLSIGGFALLWALDSSTSLSGLPYAALFSLSIAGLSLTASTLHLGRPIHAVRALRNVRRSWLSREVLALSCFAAIASAYSGLLWFDIPQRQWVGLLTTVAGLIGMFCSARLYIVPARPSWNSSYTIAEFFSTGLLLGPLFLTALGVSSHPALKMLSVSGAALQLSIQTLRFLWMTRSDIFELRASSTLLGVKFQNYFLLRLAVLIVAGIALPLATNSALINGLCFAVALGGELLGRWLFFVSVVPKNMAASFSTSGGMR